MIVIVQLSRRFLVVNRGCSLGLEINSRSMESVIQTTKTESPGLGSKVGSYISKLHRSVMFRLIVIDRTYN